jgi:hypothetical protein
LDESDPADDRDASDNGKGLDGVTEKEEDSKSRSRI